MTGDPGALAVHTDVSWAPTPNTLTVSLTAPHTDPRAAAGGTPVTSVLVLATRPGSAGRELLLVDVRTRGLDAPGGRADPGEAPQVTAVRELAEETGLTLPAGTALPAIGRLSLHVAGPAPAGYGYPHPDTCALVFTAALPAGTDPAGTTMPEEIAGHAWVRLDDVAARTGPRPWLPLLDHLPG